MSLIHHPTASRNAAGGGAGQLVLSRASSLLPHPRYTLSTATANCSTTAKAGITTSCAYSSDGRFVATATMDCHVFLWVATFHAKKQQNQQQDATATTSANPPRQPWIAIATYTLKAPATRIKFGGPNGDSLIFASLASGFMCVIDIERGAIIRSVRPPKPDKILFENAVVLNDISVSATTPDAIVSACGDDGRVTVFDLRVTGTATAGSKCFGASMPQTALAFAQSSSTTAAADEYLFCGGVDGSLRWLQRTGGELRCVVECNDAHDGIVTGIDTNCASSHGTVLSYSAFAGSVRVHDLRPWSRDDKHVLFEDDTLCTVLGESGGSSRSGVDRSLLRCAFSPNGLSIAVGTAMGAVAVYTDATAWQAQGSGSEQQRRRTTPAKSAAKSAAVAGGRFFVSPHVASVTDVAFHPQSDVVGEQVLLTASIDGTCVVACL